MKFVWAKSRSRTVERKNVCTLRAFACIETCAESHYFTAEGKDGTSVMFFVLNRSDCEIVRASRDACPVLKRGVEGGDEIWGCESIVVRVRWTAEGGCNSDGVVPVEIR